jgi:hypothetical protein
MNNLIKITKNELINQITDDNIFLFLKQHYYKDIFKLNETLKNNLINEISSNMIKKYYNDNCNNNNCNNDNCNGNNNDNCNNNDNNNNDKLIKLKENRLNYLKLSTNYYYQIYENKAILNIVYYNEKLFKEKLNEIKINYEKKYNKMDLYFKIFASINTFYLLILSFFVIYNK